MCAENSVGREGGADQRDACQAGQVGEAVNDARVWKAINWKGDLSTDDHNEAAIPSDQEFKEHFEVVLNPVDVPNHIMNFEEVTDHDEVNDAIHVIPCLSCMKSLYPQRC